MFLPEANIKYKLISGFYRGLKPDRIMTVSEWAERNRILSLAESARPGRFKITLTPYLKEIYDR